jgi:simple sugar transport system substrate-binding protein
MKWAQLWDPADAGFAMVFIGNQIAQGKKVTSGLQIPGIGAITVKGKVVAANKILVMRSAADATKAGF